MGRIGKLQSEANNKLTRIIEIDEVRYGFHPDLDSLTLGEYADIETFVKMDIDKHLPEVMAILYRPIVEEKNEIYTIEPYDGEIKMRAEEIISRSAKCTGFFLSFREGICKDYGIIFDRDDEGNESAIASESFTEKWSWFGVMYRLTGGEIVNLDAVTKLNLLEALTWLTYETDLESQNKVNYGNTK